MIDFTSSLYLGMKHGNNELENWEQLTTGVPAVLYETPLSSTVGLKVAAMQGLKNGICAPSTIHIYSDLFGLLSSQRIVLFIDEKVYPVSRYGIEKLVVSGIKVVPFRHLNYGHLQQLVAGMTVSGEIPVILTDGWCPLCGKVAPINQYVDVIKPLGGHVIIDDTQAFGILGERRAGNSPYGSGGGGTLKWLNIRDDCIISITSLAKAFGVPMAVLSGPAPFLSAFAQKSETRVSSSPVSMVHLLAALNALSINQRVGDARRTRLWQNILSVRMQLRAIGIQAGGGIFPVQHISTSIPSQAVKIFGRLKKKGIATVLISSHYKRKPMLSIVMRSDHNASQIKAIVSSIRKDIFYPQPM